MTKSLLSGVAAITFILSAPTVFAQSADPENQAEMAKEEMMDKAEAATDAMEDAADEAEEMAEEAMDDATHAMKEETMEKVVDVEPVETVTVACPEGTEAQDDGTCMVTGDWSPED